MSFLCPPTPAYRAADGTLPAPSTNNGGWLARLLGCASQPVYQESPAITTPSPAPDGEAAAIAARRRSRST